VPLRGKWCLKSLCPCFEQSTIIVQATAENARCASMGDANNHHGTTLPRTLAGENDTPLGNRGVLLSACTTEVAATPRSALARRSSSCRTGSQVSTSGKSQPDATTLEGEKQRERQ